MKSFENLEHFTPTEQQYEKFNQINGMSDDEQEERCAYVNDCSICDMAIHQHLITTTKHTCVYGMATKQFESAMDNADCDF